MRSARVSPDAQTLRGFLARVGRRVRGIAVLRAIAVAFIVATFLVITRSVAAASPGQVAIVGLAAALAGLAAGVIAGPRSARRAAALVEHRVPASKNLVLTAAEVIDGAPAVKPYIGDRISR